MMEHFTGPLEFLRLLYGHDAPGYLALWAKQDKRTTWVPAGNIEDAAATMERLAATGDVYFGVGLQREPLGPDKRGGADTVVAIPGLWADIDVAGDGHKETTYPRSLVEAAQLAHSFPLRSSGLSPSWSERA